MRKYLLTPLVLSLCLSAPRAQDWVPVTLPTGDNITGIEFLHPDTGFLSIQPGDLGRTYDGGRTWTIHPVALDLALEDVSFANAKLGLVCGKAGALYRTSDGCERWESVSPVGRDSTVAFFSVKFIDPRTALVTGMSRHEETPWSGIAYRSLDGGATWTRLEPMGLMYSEIFYSPTAGLVFPALGLLNRSDDKGKSWRQNGAIESALNRSVAVAGDLIVLVGPKGFLAVSRDNGKTWKKIEQDVERTFVAVTAIDDRTVFVAGPNSLMLRSSDGGETWTQELLARSFDVLDLARAGSRLYAVGTDGAVIYKELGRK